MGFITHNGKKFNTSNKKKPVTGLLPRNSNLDYAYSLYVNHGQDMEVGRLGIPKMASHSSFQTAKRLPYHDDYDNMVKESKDESERFAKNKKLFGSVDIDYNHNEHPTQDATYRNKRLNSYLVRLKNQRNNSYEWKRVKAEHRDDLDDMIYPNKIVTVRLIGKEKN